MRKSASHSENDSKSQKHPDLNFKRSLCAAIRVPYSEKAFEFALGQSLGFTHKKTGGGFYCSQRGKHWVVRASSHTSPDDMATNLRYTDLAFLSCPSKLPKLLHILKPSDQKAFFLASTWHSRPSEVIELAAELTGYRCARAKEQTNAWVKTNHLFM
jgi:hypothetical protein